MPQNAIQKLQFRFPLTLGSSVETPPDATPAAQKIHEEPIMAVLENSRHERFAQAVAKGVSASQAYVSTGYPQKGAPQSSARLRLTAVVCSRVSEIQETDTTALWSTLRTRIAQLITERAADMADVPGGGTGLLARQYQGALAMPVYKVDTGLMLLIGQLLAHEKQAAGKRDLTGGTERDSKKARIHRGRDRIAALKAETLAKGEVWQ
jgi:hypothetical protein